MKRYVTHWLRSRDAEKAACGANGKSLSYTSSPAADRVDCERCVKIFVKATREKDTP